MWYQIFFILGDETDSDDELYENGEVQSEPRCTAINTIDVIPSGYVGEGSCSMYYTVQQKRCRLAMEPGQE